MWDCTTFEYNELSIHKNMENQLKNILIMNDRIDYS